MQRSKRVFMNSCNELVDSPQIFVQEYLESKAAIGEVTSAIVYQLVAAWHGSVQHGAVQVARFGAARGMMLAPSKPKLPPKASSGPSLPFARSEQEELSKGAASGYADAAPSA